MAVEGQSLPQTTLVHELEADAVDETEASSILSQHSLDTSPVKSFRYPGHRQQWHHMLQEVMKRGKAYPILDERDSLENDVRCRREISAIFQDPADRLDDLLVTDLGVHEERIDPRGIYEEAQCRYASAK